MYGIVLDVVIVVLLVLTVISYAKKGLILVLLNLASYFVSAILAGLIGPQIGALICPSLERAIAGIEDIEYLDRLLSASAISDGIGFVAVFIVAMIGTSIAARFISKMIDIPIIKQINHLLGGVLGLFWAVLMVQILVAMVFLTLNLIAVFSPWAQGMFDNSFIAKWLFENNIIRVVISLK